MTENISKEKAEKLLKDGYSKAEETIKDAYKLEELIQRLENKFAKVPIAGNVMRYIPLMASMVNLYVKKVYTKVPVGTIVAIVSALIYFVSPVDFIPDFIPGIGQVDDAAVIVACLALVTADLDEYSVWRKKNGYTVEDMPDNLNEKEKSEFFKRMMREAKDPDSKQNMNETLGQNESFR